VTVVSPFPLSKPQKNYREIAVPITVDHTSLINSLVENSGSMLQFIKTQGKLTDLTMQMMNDSINTPQFKKLMAEETFDAVIIGFFINDFQVGKYNENDETFFLLY
jgi:glucuronosyltransferase